MSRPSCQSRLFRERGNRGPNPEVTHHAPARMEGGSCMSVAQRFESSFAGFLLIGGFLGQGLQAFTNLLSDFLDTLRKIQG